MPPCSSSALLIHGSQTRFSHSRAIMVLAICSIGFWSSVCARNLNAMNSSSGSNPNQTCLQLQKPMNTMLSDCVGLYILLRVRNSVPHLQYCAQNRFQRPQRLSESHRLGHLAHFSWSFSISLSTTLSDIAIATRYNAERIVRAVKCRVASHFLVRLPKFTVTISILFFNTARVHDKLRKKSGHFATLVGRNNSRI